MASRVLTALLFLLALLVIPDAALGEACTCASETFSWTAVGDNDAEWDGCTDTTNDDTFTVGSGCVVTIPAGSTVTGATTFHVTVASGGQLNVEGTLDTGTAGGITVQSGGLFVADVESTQVAIKVGTADFIGDEGSTVRMMGRIRTWGAASPGLVEDPSTSAYWQAGDIFPCPDDSGTSYNCATDGDQLRLSYAVGTPGSAVNDWDEAGFGGPPTGDSYFAGTGGNFDAVTTDDVVVFFDPTPDDAITYMNVNQPYEINALSAETANPLTIDLDVRQGEVEQSGVGADPDGSFYLHANRNFRSAVLDAAAAKGQRRFTFTATGLVAEDHDGVGKALLFAAPGSATGPALERSAYVVASAKEKAGLASSATWGAGQPDDDTLELAAREGVAEAHSAGDRVWLGTAMVRKGDPFYIMVPVRLEPSQASPTTAQAPEWHFRGTLTLVNVVLNEQALLRVGSGSTSGTVERFQRVWIQDSISSSYALDIVNRHNATWRDIWITSGKNPHGLTLECSDNNQFYDISVRFNGDDNVLVNDDPGQCSGALSTGNVMNRTRIEFAGGEYGSQSCIDAQGQVGSAVGMVFNDSYLADCSSREGDDTVNPTPDHTFGARAGTAMVANRTVIIGGHGSIANSPGGHDMTFVDLIRVGAILNSATYNHQPMKGSAVMRRFVFRDMELRHTSGTPPAFHAGDSSETDTFKDGWIDNVRVWQPNHDFIQHNNNAGNLTIDNLAFTDIWKDASGECGSFCTVLEVTPVSTQTTRVEHVGIGYRPGVVDSNLRYNVGFTMTPSGSVMGPSNKVGGILVAGLTDSTVASASALRGLYLGGSGFPLMDFTGPLCAFGNDLDLSNDLRNVGGTGAWIQQYAELIQDRSYEPPSPYYPFPVHASGAHAQVACGPKVGALAPGVRRQMWAASIAGLGPEFLADPTLGAGGGGGMWPRAY